MLVIVEREGMCKCKHSKVEGIYILQSYVCAAAASFDNLSLIFLFLSIQANDYIFF